MPSQPEWTAKQDRAALTLASGRTVRAAARSAGVSERTVHQWQGLPGFKERVLDLRGRYMARAVGRLAYGATAAATVLHKLLRSENEGVRLRAAVAILDASVKVRTVVELEERILAIEQAAEQSRREGGQSWSA
jgi:hypothetical protein